MGRKEDLEQNIRESYELIREYEAVIRTSSEPIEKARARRGIEEQRLLIEGYLGEYYPIIKRLNVVIPEDIAEITNSFSVEPPQPLSPPQPHHPLPEEEFYLLVPSRENKLAARAYEQMQFVIANLGNYLRHRTVLRQYCARLHERLSQRLSGTVFPKLSPEIIRHEAFTSVTDLLQHELVVVCGEAGCGKTRYFEACADKLAEEVIEGNIQMPIPILLRFNDLANLLSQAASREGRVPSLTQYLASIINRTARLGNYGSEWLCERYARSGRFAIFIDNFDLLNDPRTRSLAIKVIRNFVRYPRYANNRLYFASRPRLLRRDEMNKISEVVKTYSIEPWSESHFISYVMSQRDILPRVRRGAAEALAKNAPIKDLLIIPFFWDMILSLYLNDQEIPRSEFALLDTFAKSEYKRFPPPLLNEKPDEFEPTPTDAALLLGDIAKTLVLAEDDIFLSDDLRTRIDTFRLDRHLIRHVIDYLNKRCEFLTWFQLSSLYQVRHRYYRDYLAVIYLLSKGGIEKTFKFYHDEVHQKQRDADGTFSRLLFQALSVEGPAPLRKYMQIAAKEDALTAKVWYQDFVQTQALDAEGGIRQIVLAGLEKVWKTGADESQIEQAVQSIFDLSDPQAINTLIMALKDPSLQPIQVRVLPSALLCCLKPLEQAFRVLLDADNSLTIRASSLVAIFNCFELQEHGLGLHKLEPILATFEAELITALMATAGELFENDSFPLLASIADGQKELLVRASCEILGELVGRQLKVADMVFVPAGTFRYGPDDRSTTWRLFLIDKFSVSNEQYKRVADEHGAYHLYPKQWTKENANSEEWGRLPVVGINQIQAQEWSALVGKRLPDEREWEKAARWIDGRKYPWGNKWDPKKARSASSTRVPIDALPEGRSVYGCYNMSGNVWEWARGFPAGVPAYVLKGGSFGSQEPSDLCCHNRRIFKEETATNEYVGFRCCKDIDARLLAKLSRAK